MRQAGENQKLESRSGKNPGWGVYPGMMVFLQARQTSYGVPVKLKDSIAPEKLVAQIQSRLVPNSKVEHNVDLPTLDGKGARQIDVPVTGSIDLHEFKIVIDCKDQAKRLGVREVRAFHDLVQDVDVF